MEETRPYWKVIISLLFSVLATIFCIVAGVRLVVFFLPFVIGWTIAYIVNPVICFLEKRLSLKKKFSSVLVIIAVLGIVVGIAYLGIHKLVVEVGSLIQNVPDIYTDIELGVQTAGERLDGVIQLLPESVRTTGAQWMGRLDTMVGEWLTKLGEPTVEVAGSIAKRIPSILVASIVTIVSAYFFIAEREEVLVWFRKVTPRSLQTRIDMIGTNLKVAVGGYFKAQFKIMLVVGVLLFGGFLLMGVRYSALLAMLIALLDFLPFFGTGTALVPWSVYQFLTGNYKMGIMMVILYGTTQMVRQLIQPKLVGDSVGLKPLPTLVLLYIGYKVGSILGMICAVPIGMIVINMFQAGAFDYITNDVKILVKGILSLRE